MATISFDELIAKKEQREADQFRIGTIAIPGSDKTLEAKMPNKKTVLELYGEIALANTPADVIACGAHALYTCCPQLQDRTLQEQLGVAENPMGIIDALFDVSEQDKLGGAALQFLRLMPAEKTEYTDEPPETGSDAVKN